MTTDTREAALRIITRMLELHEGRKGHEAKRIASQMLDAEIEDSSSKKPLPHMPANGDTYWLRTDKSAVGMMWLGDQQDRAWFREGRCYASQQNAMAALKVVA